MTSASLADVKVGTQVVVFGTDTVEHGHRDQGGHRRPAPGRRVAPATATPTVAVGGPGGVPPTARPLVHLAPVVRPALTRRPPESPGTEARSGTPPLPPYGRTNALPGSDRSRHAHPERGGICRVRAHGPRPGTSGHVRARRAYRDSVAGQHVRSPGTSGGASRHSRRSGARRRPAGRLRHVRDRGSTGVRSHARPRSAILGACSTPAP